MQALVKKEDITEVFRLHQEAAVNTLIKTDLTALLDYEKYDRTENHLLTVNENAGDFVLTSEFQAHGNICLNTIYKCSK